MLVLSRKINEKIVIDGNIVVTVVKIDRNQVRIGIEAPGNVRVFREEILAHRRGTRKRRSRRASEDDRSRVSTIVPISLSSPSGRGFATLCPEARRGRPGGSRGRERKPRNRPTSAADPLSGRSHPGPSLPPLPEISDARLSR